MECSLPFFELTLYVFQLFGPFPFQLRVTQVYPACHLLQKLPDLAEDRSFFIFLVNSLKSTWTQVRVYAYEILLRYSDEYPLFRDKEFVNGVLLDTAGELANNPKAMLAEASALFHNLLFRKCLPQLHFIDPSLPPLTQQLLFLRHILAQIQSRTQTFYVSLIKEGKKEALIHGLLSFFKHLFSSDFSLPSQDHTAEWRLFIQDLMRTCLSINQLCKGLLSNNGLLDEIQVDCRGHPIGDGSGAETEDYENFILVGVWLAVKENGLTLFNLLNWLQLPTCKDD